MIHCAIEMEQSTISSHRNAVAGCSTCHNRPRHALYQLHGIIAAHVSASRKAAVLHRTAAGQWPRTKWAKLVVLPQLGQEVPNRT
jgi:hypothetical protein